MPHRSALRCKHDDRGMVCLICSWRPWRVAQRASRPRGSAQFIDDAEQKLLVLGVDSGRADWVKSTYITTTRTLAAKLDERAIAATVEYAKHRRGSTACSSTR